MTKNLSTPFLVLPHRHANRAWHCPLHPLAVSSTGGKGNLPWLRTFACLALCSADHAKFKHHASRRLARLDIICFTFVAGFQVCFSQHHTEGKNVLPNASKARNMLDCSHSDGMQTSNYTFDPLEDMPADFGPRVPAQGVEGFLIVSFKAVL